MLWNGVIRMPRLSAEQVHEAVELGVFDGRGLAAVARRLGQGQYSVRQPRRLTTQGSSNSSITACTPSQKRSPRGIMCANAASVSTSPSVASMAASDSALPASVPPMPLSSAAL